MSNPSSVVRRVPIDKANVLDFLARQKKWIGTTVMNEVIATSPLFIEARQQYELTAGDNRC